MRRCGVLGYEGGYDAVRRYAQSWGRGHASAAALASVPPSFAPGEAYQFDWSHEVVLIGGTTIKVTHIRLCHSRMLFVRAYPSAVVVEIRSSLPPSSAISMR